MSLPTSGPFATSRFIAELARACDAMDYDTLWAADHVTWPAEQASHHFPVGAIEAWRDGADPVHYDALTTLTYLAGITQGVRLGTAVLVLPVRNPVLLAKQAAALDELSGGRLLVGVGVGGTAFADAEFGAVGAQHLRSQRGKVMDEWLDVMRQVWTEPVVTHEGRYIEVAAASVYPKPRQKAGPPVLIGGDSEVALRRVAQRGDGSIVSRLAAPDVAGRRELLAELARPHGREDTHFHLAALRWLSIADDDETAEARAATTLARMTRGGRPLDGGVDHLVGSPRRLREKLTRDVDAGLDEVILQVVGRSEAEVLDSLTRFREEVLDEIPLDAPVG